VLRQHRTSGSKTAGATIVAISGKAGLQSERLRRTRAFVGVSVACRVMGRACRTTRRATIRHAPDPTLESPGVAEPLEAAVRARHRESALARLAALLEAAV
jgi:hypothetical protein